jgi:hypothetical protein
LGTKVVENHWVERPGKGRRVGTCDEKRKAHKSEDLPVQQPPSGGDMAFMLLEDKGETISLVIPIIKLNT